MNKKIFFLGSILALSISPAFAQWTSGGGITYTPDVVAIGLTAPVNATTHIKNLELTNVAGTSNANLKIDRVIGSFGSGMGTHISGNLMEAIVENTNLGTPPFKGFVLTSDFKLGVGTDVPASRLNVHNGNITMTNDNDLVGRQITANTTKGTLHLITGNLGPYIEMGGVNASYFQGQMNFVNSDIPSGKFEFLKHNGGGYTSQMTIRNDGKVVIGNVPVTAPATDHDYKLYVQDGILTERVKVAFHSDYVNWSDFVFAKDYELMPLSDVETYIGKNKHLPDIPSTEEVMKNGLDLATMDARLLQKVEELTLYVIEQQKQINELKKQIRKN